jgi:ATP-dependent Clp protease adaptor protein ClpS
MMSSAVFERNPSADQIGIVGTTSAALVGALNSRPAPVFGQYRLSDEPEKPGGGDNDTDRETGVVTRTRPKTQRPSRYRVLILNDDYTPMEFVVFVLERFFNKSPAEATRVMLHVHNYGVGVCGIFSYEVAETKVAQVMELARRNEHPLQCTMEKEE